eukprot:4979264-Amphidinium_carterae.1
MMFGRDVPLAHSRAKVVLCTSEIMTRPWCVGEITSAIGSGVKALTTMCVAGTPRTHRDLGKLTSSR